MMNYLSISSDYGKAPRVLMYEISGNYYVKILPKDSSFPDIVFFLDSPQDITNFKNSVLQAYEKFMKDSEDV